MSDQEIEGDFERPTPLEEEGFEFAMQWQGEAEKTALEFAASALRNEDKAGAEWWAQIAAFSATFWELHKDKFAPMTINQAGAVIAE